ncbi:hypothetical protein N0V88_000772 [Collariella sp. IMI 366227]|nr:hypothetical protein N0V88_000772 [Collariella sp. IMI 366227]
MRYPHGDLAILSAEVYHENPDYGSPGRVGAIKVPTAMSQSAVEGPRKRARTQDAQPEEPEEEKKRSRGRPRLDTKDETAADRRRTQIRLAQRAYRNRKENVIQTLEKQVQHLKNTNEEMSNVFMQLCDFSKQSGLVEQIPEFGRQLHTTTERFLSLAREASEDDKEGEPEIKPNNNQADGKASNDRSGSGSPKMPPFLPRHPGFDMLNDYSIPPYLSLPAPAPTPFETTFGRRLQRHAIERALILINMANPEAAIARVFGFCLLLESPDTIKRRLHRMLGRDVQQSLSNWQYPLPSRRRRHTLHSRTTTTTTTTTTTPGP